MRLLIRCTSLVTLTRTYNGNGFFACPVLDIVAYLTTQVNNGQSYIIVFSHHLPISFVNYPASGKRHARHIIALFHIFPAQAYGTNIVYMPVCTVVFTY